MSRSWLYRLNEPDLALLNSLINLYCSRSAKNMTGIFFIILLPNKQPSSCFIGFKGMKAGGGSVRSFVEHVMTSLLVHRFSSVIGKV